MKLKWIAVAIVGVIVVVIGGAYIYLTTLDLEEVRGLVQAEAKKATGRDLVLAGDLDLGISFTPSVGIGDVSFANADWGSREDMVKVERLEVEVELMPLFSGDIQVNRFVLRGADILLETNAEGRANWEFDVADAKAEPEGAAKQDGGQSVMPAIRRVLIEDSRLTFRNGETGEEMKVGLDKVSAEGDGRRLTLDAAGSYQEAPFSVAGELGGIEVVLAKADYPVKLNIEAGGAKIALDGVVRGLDQAPTPDLQISVEGQSLADMNALAGGGLPALGPYSVSGKLSGGAEAIQLAGLTAKIGGSDLAGNLGVALGGARPKVTAELTSTLFDLADVQAEGGEEPAGEAAPAKDSPYVIPETPLPLDALKAVDAEVTAKVGTLRVQEGTEMQDLEVKLSLAGGKLAVSPLAAQFAGGSIAGAVTLDGAQATPALVTDVKVSQLDLGTLLQTYAGSEHVKGKMDITIDLKGAGASPRAIAASLNGRTEVLAEDGVINNKILAIVAAGAGEILNPLFGGANETKLNCLISRFDIKNGVATSEAQVLDSSSFSLAGEGTVDLRDESLDLKFDTSSRQTAIVSLAVPFNVGGTMKNPSVAPDPMGTAAKVAQLAGTAGSPVAALSFMVADDAVAGAENPCMVALDKAESGETPPTLPGMEGVESLTKSLGGDTGEAIKSLTEGGGEGAEEAIEGVTKGIKGLFGN